MSAPKKKSLIRPWMVLLAIAVIAVVVTLIVAMSGPEVRPNQGGPGAAPQGK